MHENLYNIKGLKVSPTNRDMNLAKPHSEFNTILKQVVRILLVR